VQSKTDQQREPERDRVPERGEAEGLAFLLFLAGLEVEYERFRGRLLTSGPITIPSTISSTIDGNRIRGKSPSASGAASAAAATTANPVNGTFVS
jgi:hypothetical protein